MRFSNDMDDPYDRPEFVDNHLKEMADYREESIRQTDELANEKHDVAELF